MNIDELFLICDQAKSEKRWKRAVIIFPGKMMIYNQRNIHMRHETWTLPIKVITTETKLIFKRKVGRCRYGNDSALNPSHSLLLDTSIIVVLIPARSCAAAALYTIPTMWFDFNHQPPPTSGNNGKWKWQIIELWMVLPISASRQIPPDCRQTATAVSSRALATCKNFHHHTPHHHLSRPTTEDDLSSSGYSRDAIKIKECWFIIMVLWLRTIICSAI